MAMLMLMTMRSSVALRLMEEYLRFFIHAPGEGNVCFFCSKQQGETTENRDSANLIK